MPLDCQVLKHHEWRTCQHKLWWWWKAKQMEWHWQTGPNSDCDLWHQARLDATAVSRGGKAPQVTLKAPFGTSSGQKKAWGKSHPCLQWAPLSLAEFLARISGHMGPVESHRLPSANLAVSFFWYYLHWLLCEIKSMKSCFWVYAVSETLNNDTNFSLCKNLRFLQPSRQWLLLKADLLVWRVAENSQCGKEWFQCYPQGALWDSGKTTTQPDLWRCWTMLPQLPGRAKNLSRNLPV